MKLCSGEFETKVEDGCFGIFIKDEGDFSCDGGHTFEEVTAIHWLTKQDAQALADELLHFIQYGK
jgi:hypothetical protein